MLEPESGEIRNVVLVHGGFVDGSGWEPVYRLLRTQGFEVSVVQHPTTSLADDVRAVRQVLGGAKGPAILVGHSYWVGCHLGGRQRSQGRGPDVHRGIRPGHRGVGRFVDPESTARSTGPADSAA
jgi:hypothetical protein